jgi:hypothetical protein
MSTNSPTFTGTITISSAVIAELEEAVRRLEPPFLALPEDGWTAEKLAYQRGARDAYLAVLKLLPRRHANE